MRDDRKIAFNRRQLLKASGLIPLTAFAIPALSACGDGGSSGGQLTAWGVVSFTKEGDRQVEEQMQEWGDANGFTVEYSPVPGSNYPAKLATAVEAGSLPDVVMLEDTQPIYYGGQGHLENLTDLFTELKGQGGGMFDTLTPYVAVPAGTYAIPMETNLTVMYARLDLIEKVTGQRTPPTTLDDLEAIARAAQTPPDTYGIGLPLGKSVDGNSILSIIYADGGRLVDEQGNPAVDNDGTVAALTRIQRWWQDKLIPPDAPSSDDAWNNQVYQSKRAAFVFNAPSIYGWLQENDPDLLKNTAQAPLPAGKVDSVQAASCWSWAVSAKSKNVDPAKDLIRYIMAPERVEKVYEKVAGRWYPVYRDLVTNPYWQEREAFRSFPQIIDNARTNWYPATATAELLTRITSVTDSFVPLQMAVDVTLQGMSPAQAAKRAQEQMEQLFV
jgi:ABC-type glycerol-3-phosphate transport system substrate-binding protein